MAVVNTARRLSNKIIDTDIESLNGLSTVEGYIPVRSEATPTGITDRYEVMLAKQQRES
jgi:hypothetical protein